MIITVFIGQINKNLYDSIAETFLGEILNPTDYVDLSFLYLYNNICMFADCFNIIQGAISLLKYTVKAVPELQAITETVQTFIKETFAETITMIMIVYLLFGFLSYYMLAYYQFGFFYVTYALLRSCIVFLNGFIINEQQIFLSKESIENLIRMNGFLLTLFSVLIINILIRQVMVNIVAIYMHNDYHSSKLRAKEEQLQKKLKFEDKIMMKVKQNYNSRMAQQFE